MTTAIAQNKKFEPYIIHAGDYFSLEEIPLLEVLEHVRQYKLLVLRGFAAMECKQFLKYCQSQAKLLFWESGPVMEMKVDAQTRNYLFTNGDVPLHWDGAFYQEPRYLVFHCLQAPLENSGGETLFINTEMVWERLNRVEQEEWREYELSFSTEKLAHYGGNIRRKLVDFHPDTGAVILRYAEPVDERYLNPVTVKVTGKNTQESTEIIQKIRHKMRSPCVCYAHQWNEGDYLLADNFSLLHGRNAFHKNSPRHLRRIQIL